MREPVRLPGVARLSRRRRRGLALGVGVLAAAAVQWFVVRSSLDHTPLAAGVAVVLVASVFGAAVGLDARRRTVTATGFVGPGTGLAAAAILADDPFEPPIAAAGVVGIVVATSLGVAPRRLSLDDSRVGFDLETGYRRLLQTAFVAGVAVVLLATSASGTSVAFVPAAAAGIAACVAVVVAETVLTDGHHRVLLVGPDRSGRRSVVSGLRLAVRESLNGAVLTDPDPTPAESAIDGGSFPETTADDPSVHRLRYRHGWLFPVRVDLIAAVTRTRPDASGGLESVAAKFVSLSDDVPEDPARERWERAVGKAEGSLSEPFADWVARAGHAADAVLCVVPLDDFCGPAVCADAPLLDEQQSRRFVVGERDQATLRDIAVERGFRSATDTSEIQRRRCATGVYYDVGRPHRERPGVYLDAYHRIQAVSGATTSVRTLATMADFAKRHYQRSLEDTERTLRTFEPTGFSTFVRETYLRWDAPHVPSDVDAAPDPRPPFLTWYDRETAGEMITLRDGGWSTLRGSRWLLEWLAR